MKLLELTREEYVLADRLSVFGNTFAQIVAHYAAGLPKIKHRRRDRAGKPISGNWNYVPNKYNIAHQLFRIQKTLSQTTNKRPVFIDYGAGLGNIMSLANSLYCKAYGIEYDTNYVKALMRCFDSSCIVKGSLRNKSTIKQMLNLYKSHYNEKSPVIHYMYRPLEDVKGQEKLINDIISCANRKVDNYFIFTMIYVEHFNVPLERIESNIYILKKQTSVCV